MALRLGETLEAARTTALCTLILSQLIHVFECKSETKSLFHLPLWNNWKLLAAVAVSAGILFAAVKSSALQMIFTTVPLSLPLWIVVAVSSCAIPICSAILFQITAKKKGEREKYIGDSLAADSHCIQVGKMLFHLPLWIIIAVSSCTIPICSAILFQITAKKKGGQ